jgi:hypothetical protein
VADEAACEKQRMSSTRPSRDSQSLSRIWIEELLGSDLPARGPSREAMVAGLLDRGGEAAFRRFGAAMRQPRKRR